MKGYGGLQEFNVRHEKQSQWASFFAKKMTTPKSESNIGIMFVLFGL